MLDIRSEASRALVRLLLNTAEDKEELLQAAVDLAEALDESGVDRDPMLMRRIANTVCDLLGLNEE